METEHTGTGGICVICSTVPPSRSTDIAQRLLEKKLVACVNIAPVRSLYTWKGESCDDTEHLLIMKTQKRLAEKVIRVLKGIHPYEVPEIIVQQVTGGNAEYLAWVNGVTEKP
jgi:periplasmic divalent cation tolerance protein